MSWPMVKLSEICSVLSGFTFKSNYFGDSGIPLVRIRDVMKGFSETYYSGEYDEQFVVNNNDILIGMDGDFNIAKWAGGEALLNQRVCKITPDLSVVDADYLFYFLPLKLKEIWDETAFVTVKHLSVKKINDIDIPLPELSIQKDISAMLRVSDSLRDQSKKMESELNALAQAVFVEMFGDPVSNPKEWDVKPLKDLVVDFQGGKSLVAADSLGDSANNRVLKISAVTSGEFDCNESKALPDDYFPPKEHFVRRGDLLFSRANTTELVGATSLVFEVPDNILLPDKIWRFVWKEPESVSQCFFWQLLRYRTMREQLSKISSGSGGSMKNISKGKLNELTVVVPPLEKQLQFEKIFMGIRAQKEVNRKVKCKSEKMFNALMQRAFSGKTELKNVA
ncbi:restriction endonuclease subunit S [Pectobacterium brasiliense]|uniref:restriction endonuclease subunit S n=1 Tax=Pectobacterium brasiliense TaxID=180957 RepID=UPI003986720A